jgi:glutaredoxin
LAVRCLCDDECRNVVANRCPYCRKIPKLDALDLYSGSQPVCSDCRRAAAAEADADDTDADTDAHADAHADAEAVTPAVIAVLPGDAGPGHPSRAATPAPPAPSAPAT